VTHPVYPGGPDCQPNCPGPWSMYHDGYADGYERAEANPLRQSIGEWVTSRRRKAEWTGPADWTAEQGYEAAVEEVGAIWDYAYPETVR
jgi:hypothetical protein